MLDATTAAATSREPGLLWRLARFLGLTRLGFGRWRCWGNARQCAAFTSAFVALAAKMAKADGVAIATEASTFEKFLEVEPHELANVRRLYAQAQSDTAGFETYAERIAAMLADDPETKRRVFESLFYVACSDGILHPAEDKFLHVVADHFGYDAHTYRAIRATFVHDPDDPYTVLDMAPNSSDRAVKSRYRKLMFENHPDRLIAMGAPAAAIKAATAKAAAVNDAYNDIAAQRAAAPVS